MLRQDRINQIVKITKSTRYLEIGVREGATLKNVNCTEKYGVDPKFRFDKTTYLSQFACSESVALSEETSDCFFGALDENGVPRI